MSAKNPKCPICHNEYLIVKDLLFTGMGPAKPWGLTTGHWTAPGLTGFMTWAEPER